MLASSNPEMAEDFSQPQTVEEAPLLHITRHVFKAQYFFLYIKDKPEMFYS